MYLMQVAHESRQEGAQTSIYCVRWDLLIGSSTIDRIAGQLLLQEPGFTPPSDAERGAWQCNGFDERPDPVPQAPPAPPPTIPTPACPQGGLVVQITGASSNQDFASIGGSGWTIRADLLVTNDSDAPIQLSGISPKIGDRTQTVTALFGSIGPWRTNTVLSPGQSIQATTSVIASQEAGTVFLTEAGGWTWPDFPNC